MAKNTSICNYILYMNNIEMSINKCMDFYWKKDKIKINTMTTTIIIDRR